MVLVTGTVGRGKIGVLCVRLVPLDLIGTYSCTTLMVSAFIERNYRGMSADQELERVVIGVFPVICMYLRPSMYI